MFHPSPSLRVVCLKQGKWMVQYLCFVFYSANTPNFETKKFFIEQQTKADNILELAGLGLFCDYLFINRICKIRL